MIDLVLVVCLSGAPLECRRERLPFEGPVYACAVHGQQVAAQWAESHPKWRIAGWRCGPAELAI